MYQHSLHRAAAAVMVLSVLAACKKTAPPPAQAPVEVASVDLGRQIGPDNRVVQSMTTFGVNDTIYASVATTGAATSAVLTAKWTYQTGQTVDSTTMTIAPTGPAQTEFHIMKASPWPAGGYTLAIWLNGQSVGQKAFEVK
jgi:hypothetical protein